eukprot:m51a1_g5722 hypothetical protein (302) ;mRNA; f:1108247-1109746
MNDSLTLAEAPRLVLSFKTILFGTRNPQRLPMDIIVARQWRESCGVSPEDVYSAGAAARACHEDTLKEVVCDLCGDRIVEVVAVRRDHGPACAGGTAGGDVQTERYSFLVRACCRHIEHKLCLSTHLAGVVVSCESFKIRLWKRKKQPSEEAPCEQAAAAAVAASAAAAPAGAPGGPKCPEMAHAIPHLGPLPVAGWIRNLGTGGAPLAGRIVVRVRVTKWHIPRAEVAVLLTRAIKEVRDNVPGFINGCYHINDNGTITAVTVHKDTLSMMLADVLRAELLKELGLVSVMQVLYTVTTVY